MHLLSFPIKVTEVYGTDDFQLPSRDNKGHDVNISFRCMTQMAGEVSEIIAARAFNYRTAADLHRHALWRHLQWLKEKAPELRERMSWVEAVVAITQAEEDFIEYEAVTDYLARTVDSLKQRGEEGVGEARRLVLQVSNQIIEGDGTTTLKRRYLKLIMKRHLRLLQKRF